MECYGRYHYVDGLVRQIIDDETIPEGDISFYEVIRTIDGIPFFFDDHIARLKSGIATRYHLPAKLGQKIAEGIEELANTEKYHEINVRITVIFTGQEHILHICYIPSSYPSEEMYERGVKVILFRAERLDPSLKTMNRRLRLAINEELTRKQAYEALLVNNEGFITEGSRSNIFFISDRGQVYTSPDRMVLSGVTRKHITGLCNKNGIELVYEPVSVSNLDRFPYAFLTGTSPMVLEIKEIEKKALSTGSPIAGALLSSYRNLAAVSLTEYAGRKYKD